MRNLLIRLAVKYQGDYFKVREAFKKQESGDGYPLQQAITIFDQCYPKQLLQLQYPPLVLFYKGNIELLKEDKMAVVGSRKAFRYGIEMTKDIVNKIKDDYVIVSGMAKGIDGVAHKCASKTIGVLGNGLDVIYPKENYDLYQYMGKNQLLISEYPYGVQPERYHFPFRNRIIAGLAKGVIVTQASTKSGTMLTVNEALALNRDVYAVSYPYNIADNGCNLLIEQGAILLDIDNIRYMLKKNVDKSDQKYQE